VNGFYAFDLAHDEAAKSTTPKFSMRDSRRELPLLIFVVAIKISNPSCFCDKKRIAETSVKVMPPTTTTSVTLLLLALAVSCPARPMGKKDECTIK